MAKLAHIKNIKRLSHSPSDCDIKKKEKKTQNPFVVAPFLVGNLYKVYWESFGLKDCGLYSIQFCQQTCTHFMKVTAWVRILLFFFVKQGFGLDYRFKFSQFLKVHNLLLLSASLVPSFREKQQGLFFEQRTVVGALGEGTHLIFNLSLKKRHHFPSLQVGKPRCWEITLCTLNRNPPKEKYRQNWSVRCYL